MCPRSSRFVRALRAAGEREPPREARVLGVFGPTGIGSRPTTHFRRLNVFIAHTVAIELIHDLRDLVPAIKQIRSIARLQASR